MDSGTTWRRLAGMAALGLIATLCAAGPAVADPTNKGLPVAISCDNGETYAAVFRGGADWNVFLDTGSTSVFVPTLQQFNGTLTDPAGNVLFERHDRVIEKGNSDGRQGTPLHCTFQFQNLRDDGNTFTAWGDISGYLTPAA